MGVLVDVDAICDATGPIWYTPKAELVQKQEHYYGLQPFLP